MRPDCRYFVRVQAIVIGAGIGGIAAAIRAAHLGYEVLVLEAAKTAGGKLSSFTENGYRFDRGPSLFTMPEYVDELFELCGERAADSFRYSRQEVVCRYFWPDGKRLCAWADLKRFAAEAERAFGVEEQIVLSALTAAERKYVLSGRTFLEKPLHKASTWLTKQVAATLPHLGEMDLFESMHSVNARLLKEPHLIQLFDRFATYNGSSPYRAPGMLTVIPTFEHILGTYLPHGGMHDITSSLVNLAERQGVRFQYGNQVSRVLATADKVTGVELETGVRIPCDTIISNADVHSFYRYLLPASKQPTRTLRQERSTSALIFYWGLRGESTELGLHNIFFSNDYEAEFTALQAGTIANDFTVYVNLTSKHVKGEAPTGQENWFVMVNAPYDQGQNWDAKLQEVRERTIAKLSRELNRDLESEIEYERTWTPPGIARDTGSHLGALYGTSSNSRWAAFLRHRNDSAQYDNLFFVGGSVHPGGGVPLALLSAKIATGLMPKAH